MLEEPLGAARADCVPVRRVHDPSPRRALTPHRHDRSLPALAPARVAPAPRSLLASPPSVLWGDSLTRALAPQADTRADPNPGPSPNRRPNPSLNPSPNPNPSLYQLLLALLVTFTTLYLFLIG